MRLRVVKVGGSLYDLADLGGRLKAWLSSPEGAGTRTGSVLLVPGGGPAADAVRGLDSRHGLGEEASHWLALRALTLNAHFLARLLPEATVVPWPGRVPPLTILDAHAFAACDDGQPGCLPHTWAATSDAVAARAAPVGRADELVLLKSVDVPAEGGWEGAAAAGVVDPTFPQLVRQADLRARAVNLRMWGP